MIRLKSLQLKNFKSFQKARIPFRGGFTVIIGPNGSGKSNILDALLFGLGTGSLKLLRASRLTELINSSVVENYGKVEILLKEKKKDYTISRTIDNKGRSICRLNGDRKPLNEVTALLRELGLENAGHNIVAQGDVTQIIEHSPLERRQILDEVAGIAEFDEKRNEAYKELAKVEQKVKDANLVISEKEGFLSELEKDMQAARTHKELSSRLQSARATVLHGELARLKKQSQQVTQEKQEAKKEVEELEERLEELRGKVLQKEEALEQMGSDMLEEQRTVLSATIQERENARAAFELSQEKARGLRARVEEGEQELSRLEEEASTAKDEEKAIEARIREIGVELSALSEEEARLMQECEASEEQSADSRASLSSAERELEQAESSFREIERRLLEVESRIASFAREQKRLAQEHAELAQQERDLFAQRRSLEKAEEERASLAAKNPGAVKAQCEKELKTVQASHHKRTASLLEARHALEELSKASSSCPVCARALTTAKKKALTTQHTGQLEKLAKQEKAHSAKLKELEKKREEAEKGLRRLEGLTAQTKSLEEVRKHHTQTKSRVHVLSERLEKEHGLANQKAALLRDFEEKEEAASQMRAAVHARREELPEQLLESRESLAQARQKIELHKQERARLQEDTEKARTAQETASMRKEELKKALSGREEEAAALEDEAAKAKKKLNALEEKSRQHQEEMEKRRNARENVHAEVQKLRSRVEDVMARSGRRQRKAQDLEVEMVKLEVRSQDLEEEKEAYEGVALLDEPVDALQKELPKMERKIESLGAINMKAAETYESLSAELHEVKGKVEKLQTEQHAVESLISSIEDRRNAVFMKCFTQIKGHFERLFYSFFDGKGEMVLSDEQHPLESGLVIRAKHKGENLRTIDQMSGGEKTLTAIAFLFSLQLYNPAPFYIMDEADAALDAANSARLTQALKEMSKNAQFIAITHNNTLIKEADQVVGVTLDKNNSSVVGLDLKDKMKMP